MEFFLPLFKIILKNILSFCPVPVIILWLLGIWFFTGLSTAGKKSLFLLTRFSAAEIENILYWLYSFGPAGDRITL